MLFYRPVQDKRYFSKGQKYDAIDWTDFRQIVDAFEARIEDWYIRPGDALRMGSWDNSFALMAIDCLLIDTLSQFYYGELFSSRRTFKKYVRKNLPEFRKKLPEPILARPTRRKRRKAAKNKRKLKPKKQVYYYKFADILYHCFRCGILHEAHVASCGGLACLSGKMVDVDPETCTLYRNQDGCPTVRMDPIAIFDEVKKLFNVYIGQLLDQDPKFDSRRKFFRRKFTDCIGIDITGVM